MPARLAVLLTCHNRRDLTLACLERLFAQPLDGVELDVVLHDADSTDGTPEAVRKRFPDVTVLRGSDDQFWNRGMHDAFAHAMGRGGYDHYLWLNDDTMLDEEAVGGLLATHRDLAGSREHPVVLVGVTRHPELGTVTYGGIRCADHGSPLRFERLGQVVDEPTLVDTMNGNCVLLPAAAVARVGNLDPTFFHGLGDYDYGLRAKRAGCEVYVAPGTVGTCAPNALPRTRTGRWHHVFGERRIRFRSWFTFARRWGGPTWPLRLPAPYVRRIQAVVSNRGAAEPISSSMRRGRVMLDGMQERVPARLRPVLRRAVATGVRGLGAAGAPRLARGKRDTRALDVLARKLGDGVDLSASFTVEERPRPPVRLRHAGRVAVVPRPVSTFNLVLDVRRPDWSFQQNVVVDHERYVYAEDRIFWDALEVSRGALQSPEHVSGTVAYLSNTDVANFGHWTFLTLPLIERYRAILGTEPDRYYVGEPLRDHHVEMLGLLGISRDRVLTGPVTADRLIAVVASRRWGALESHALGWTRAAVAPESVSGSGTRRLFVGRGTVRFRNFLNEAECAALLAEHGFEHVTMDGLTVADEIALFSQAEAVVGVCGAALTNLAWTPPGVKILELMSHDYNPPFFMELAAHLGADYGYLVGRVPPGVDLPPGGQEENLQRRSDVLIDLDELRDALRSLDLARPRDG